MNRYETHSSEGAVPVRPALVWPAGAGADLRARELETWLARMRPHLLRLAGRLLDNSHDAEEVVQESLVTAWRRVGELDEPGKRNAWLYRVVVNLSRHRLRRRRRTRIAWAPSPQREPAGHAIEQDELMERVRRVMDKLPIRQRIAVVLRDMEQLEYEQIAAILAARPAAVRILVHRGRQGLRRILLRRWPTTFEDFASGGDA